MRGVVGYGWITRRWERWRVLCWHRPVPVWPTLQGALRNNQNPSQRFSQFSFPTDAAGVRSDILLLLNLITEASRAAASTHLHALHSSANSIAESPAVCLSVCLLLGTSVGSPTYFHSPRSLNVTRESLLLLLLRRRDVWRDVSWWRHRAWRRALLLDRFAIATASTRSRGARCYWVWTLLDQLCERVAASGIELQQMTCSTA